ncbi:MAG: TatD family hydrolase [Lachnospiraceae bacterium]|nr:TatD family hydrolase [Lachnospiraceae bacterium]MBQ8948123.1 TatD family hydrolase [Lachnospiraceae bacterium]
MIFDTHAHYDDAAFDDDRDELLSGMPAKGIGRIVNVTANYDSIEKSLVLAGKYDHVYTSAGLHPTEIYDLDMDEVLRVVEDKCRLPKVVAIGEIGLDYHYDDTDEAKQRAYFEAQLEIALRAGLPVIIHSRDAGAETFDHMKAFAAKGGMGVIHCYSYSYEMAAEYVKLGYYIGIGGVVTFKNSRKLKECAQKLPLSSILLETDCPYLSPDPKRGQRNSSLNLPYVAAEIARLRGITIEEVTGATWDNAMKMYGMS